MVMGNQFQGSTFSQFAPPSFFTNFNGPVAPTSSLSGPFAEFLEQEPRIPFGGAVQRASLTPNQRSFFRGQFDNIFGQYEGLIDQYSRSGQTPDARFGDFVGNFDFQDEFNRLLPRQRPGLGTQNFAPRTTFLR
jgi:hypothetical protein